MEIVGRQHDACNGRVAGNSQRGKEQDRKDSLVIVGDEHGGDLALRALIVRQACLPVSATTVVRSTEGGEGAHLFDLPGHDQPSEEPDRGEFQQQGVGTGLS